LIGGSGYRRKICSKSVVSEEVELLKEFPDQNGQKAERLSLSPFLTISILSFGENIARTRGKREAER
jgi:hypothetical protein